MKRITEKERFLNFILSGCEFSTIYFVLNYISNGFKFDKKTEYEYFYSYFIAQSDMEESQEDNPSETIENNLPDNVLLFEKYRFL